MVDCAGSQPSLIEKMLIRMTALTNSGRPMKAKDPTEID